jgi:hypothetical protein
MPRQWIFTAHENAHALFGRYKYFQRMRERIKIIKRLARVIWLGTIAKSMMP